MFFYISLQMVLHFFYSHNGQTYSDPVSREKGHLSIVPGTASLRLSHVTTSDAGVYECRVDFYESPSQISLVNMSVIGEFVDYFRVYIY